MHGYKKPKVDWTKKKNNRNAHSNWNENEDFSKKAHKIKKWRENTQDFEDNENTEFEYIEKDDR